MGAFADWLKNLFGWAFDCLWNLLVDLFNAIIVAFCAIFSTIIELLPTVDASAPVSITDSDFLGFLNWFLPVGHMVQSLGLYITAMLLYFGIGPLLRWVKVIK